MRNRPMILIQMAPRSSRPKVNRKSPGLTHGAAEPRTQQGHGPNQLGETKQAADNIIASWALQEFVAQRALEGTRG